jgi:predicted outer membrane repeat protein
VQPEKDVEQDSGPRSRTSGDSGRERPGLRAGWSLTWRIAATLAVGAALMLVLGGTVLALSRDLVALDTARSASAAVGLAAGTVAVMLLAGAVAMAVTASGIALLVRDLLDAGSAAPRLRLGRSLATAVAVVPQTLLLLAAAVAAVVLLVVLAPVVTLALLVRCGWQLARGTVPRRRALTGLLSAVPFAVALRATAAAPAVYASLLNRAPLRDALRAARAQRLRTRAFVLAGLVAVLTVNAVLTGLTLTGLQAGPAFYAVLGLTLLLAGAGAGVLAHTPARDGGGGAGVAPRRSEQRRTRRHLRLRQARVAAVTAFAVVVGTVGVATPALAAPAAEPAPIVVGTTDDASTTVDPTQCRDGAPCGIRAALAVAATRAADTNSATVTFDESLYGQTITLAGTLTVAAGVTVDTRGHAVTLDAHRAFRALEAVAPGAESPQVTLRGLTVTGGRVAGGGAGLWSDSARVDLVDVTFADNVASGGAGGAVALPGRRLTVEGSTFTGNRAGTTGGAIAAGVVVLSNSTLVDNTASGTTGGAVSATSGGQVSHATVSGAGGIAGSAGQPLLVTNTLVTGPAGSWVACSAIATGADGQSPSAGNVDASGTCLGTTADPQPLGPLADNGGTTRTMLPGAGNPALAAGSAEWCEDSDQRHEPRSPAACDAGAVQVSDAPPAEEPPAPVQTELATVELLLNPANRFSAGEPLVFRATVYPGQGGASTAGTLQMVENGTLLGAPVAVTTTDANYELTVPTLSQGPHTVVLRHVPTGGRTRQDSAPLQIGVTVPSKVTVTTAAAVQVGDPATLVATVGDDPGNGPALDPSAPEATGTATFRFNNGQSADVPVVDGVATLHVDSLTSPAATVVYDGDEWYAEGQVDQFDLFGADVPTRTTATVSTPEVQLGEQTRVAVRVTDSRGVAPAGLVHLVVDGTERDLERLDGGTAVLSAALPLGTSTGYVTYSPDAGWSGSRSSAVTATVTPVRSGIALSYDAAHPAAWPAAPYLPFTATGESGPATVRLLAGSTVLAEQQVTLPATGSFVLPVGSYDVGTRTLHAELVATPTMAGARSADVPVTIVPGTTTVTLSPEPGARVGVLQTVTVHAGGSRPATLVVTRDDGREVARQLLPVSGDGTFTATPPAVRTQLTATVTYADGRYAPATSSTTVTADAAPTTAQLSWASAGTEVDTDPAQLRIVYATTAGLPAPTGTVTLRDRVGTWAGYGTLVDGVVTVALRGDPGRCYCATEAVTVSYSGDAVYAARSDTAPDLTNPGRATTTALVVTTPNLRPGQPVAMTVRVTAAVGTPAGEVTVSFGGDVFATGTLVDGRADVAGTVPAGATGPVTLTARYLPALPAWRASQVAVAATVVPFAPPSVVLSVAPGTHRIGVPESLGAAVRSSDPAAPLDTSAGLEVRDDTGALVGRGTWLSNGTADLTITPVHAGDRTLTATYRYGDGKQGTSQPLALRVQGVQVPLTVTAQGPAAVGRHLVVRVTGQVPAGIDAGPLTVQLSDRGRPTGIATPLSVDASGALSATVSVVPERKGQVDLVAVSEGDGADVARASGSTTLTVAPATMTLRPVTGLLAPATYGSRVTTPAVVLDGSVGGTPDGRLVITLIDPAGGEHPGCTATLPETRCSIETSSLDPGTYTLAHRLSGSAVFDDVAQVLGAQLPVQLARTTVDTRFSTVPGLWVAGQQVTATFTVRDTLTTSGNASGVIRLESSYGPLCYRGLIDGRTAECTFTVPWPTGAPTGELDQRLTTTFTPTSRFTTGSDDVSLFRAPLRCYTATSDRSYDVSFDSGVPVVAGGQACASAGSTGDRAGTSPGFVEGSQLTVAADLARTGTGWAFTGMTATPAGGTGYLLAAEAGSDRVQTAPLTANTRFVPSYRWAPTCVQVSTGYEDLEGLGRSRADYAVYTSWREGAVARPANSVLLETPSNCGQPFGGMTTEERADYAQGVGHYVVGTQVQVQPVTSNPYRPTLAMPDWQLTAMPGATEDAAGFWHLTARPGPFGAPMVAYGVWRWAPTMCGTVETGAGTGGTVAVTSSSFPRSLAPMEDPTGACVTTSGRPGFLAGTTVTATATPTNARTTGGRQPAIGETYLYRWPTGSAEVRDRGTVQPTSEVPGRSGGISGDPYAAHTATDVVALDRGTYFGATFAKIDCVPVTLALDGLTVAGAGLTPGTCAAVPGDQQDDRRTTRYYTAGTQVAFSPAVPTKKDAYGRSVALRWKVEVTGTDGAQTLTFGPTGAFDVRRTTTGALLTASYVDTACREVRLAEPQLPGYSTFIIGGDCPRGETDGTQTQASTSVPDAARANGVLPQWKILSRDPKAVLSGLDNPAMSSRDTYPLVSHYDTIIYRGQLSVDLTYCRPVADLVTVSLVDAVGHPLGTWGAPDPARTMESYNDRCVGNDVPVEAFSQLDLTDDAKRKWTVVGWKNDRTGALSLTDLSPRFRVDGNGATADHWTLLVQPRCYRLQTGDRVSALTAPTCAGQDPANGLYTAGSVVDLSFADAYDITLHSWNGVSSSSGSTAQATMDGDRQVYAYWTERHVSGIEKAAMVMSNVGQRLVAGVMTGVNLFVLEPIAGILAAGPVFGAIADGLSAIGLGGAVADGLRSLGNLMSKTSDALNAWGSCTTAWATGSEDVNGVLTASGTTKTVLDKAESGAEKGAGVLDQKFATEAFGSGLKDVGTLRDTINLFTSNFSAYTQDPEKAWGGMVDSLNDCFKAKAEGVVDAGRKMGG